MRQASVCLVFSKEEVMCGIVGYVGKNQAAPILLDGLSKLEYRGYDSSGVAVIADNETKIYKAEGKLQNLKDLLSEKQNEVKNARVGIGHIRWATHGIPNEINAHPHTNNDGKLAVVHNGIIESYQEVKEKAAAAEAENTKKAVKKINANVEKTTLGDIDALAALKDKLEKGE